MIEPGQEGYEACDDGNDQLGDGCSGECLREVCGNGVQDHGEAVDGNEVGGDGCDNAVV